MKRLALLALTILALCSTARAGEVAVLPEDGSFYYISLIGQPGETKFEALKEGFLHNPKLNSLESYTHISVLPTSEKLYQERYAKTVAALPCLRVTTPDGTVVYQDLAAQAPATAEAAAGKILPLCPKPSPSPSPAPGPSPGPSPTPDVNPNVTPDTPPAFPPVWAFMAAVLVGAGVGFVDYWKHSN